MYTDLERRRHAISHAKGMPVVHVPREQHPTPQSATLSLNVSGQLFDKPQGLSLDDNAESGV